MKINWEKVRDDSSIGKMGTFVTDLAEKTRAHRRFLYASIRMGKEGMLFEYCQGCRYYADGKCPAGADESPFLPCVSACAQDIE